MGKAYILKEETPLDLEKYEAILAAYKEKNPVKYAEKERLGQFEKERAALKAKSGEKGGK